MSSETGKTQEAQQEKQEAPVCPQCGAGARRREARFCSACGGPLEENYRPADALRASYYAQRPANSSRGDDAKGTKPLPPGSTKRSMSTMLPDVNRNGASTTALAFTTYALVPFLGILFVPGAVLIGVAGLFYSYRAPHRGGRRASIASVFFGLLILGIQLVLWWIIVNVPQWSNPATGGY